MVAIPFNTAYKPGPPVRVFFTEPSLTKQAFAEETDINRIMARFEKTNLLNHVNEHQGNYGNFITDLDYRAAMQAVVEAQEAFDTLPAKIRARFANSPADFLGFVQNPDNLDEMVKLGLANAPAAPVVPPGAQPPAEAPPVAEPELIPPEGG